MVNNLLISARTGCAGVRRLINQAGLTWSRLEVERRSGRGHTAEKTEKLTKVIEAGGIKAE
jgi:hypothetical protein